MVNDFELADGCKEILAEKDITVFTDTHGEQRAVFRIDNNQDPLPHCDPNRFGYALTMVNFIDGHEGVAICSVVDVTELLASHPNLGLEVIEAV